MNNKFINNGVELDLLAEKQAIEQNLEKWHTIFELFSFLPPVSDYLDEYNIK